MRDTGYLALASFQDNSSVEVNSVIFNVTNDYDTTQLIPACGASDWEYFEINDTSYLAVSEFINDAGSYCLSSSVYVYSGSSWEPFQELSTKGAYDMEFLTDGQNHFLAVANQRESENGYFINSMIYQWLEGSFNPIQEISTYGASDWEGFLLDDVPCFGVANTFFAGSHLYRWNGQFFEAFQTLPSFGATGMESFRVDGALYLALANGRSLMSYETESVIYKFDGENFDAWQNIPTTGAFDWEYFESGGLHFLACAEYRDDDANFSLDSHIFQYTDNGFDQVAAVPTHGAVDWEFFDDCGNPALIIANYKKNGDHITQSQVFHLDLGTQLISETENPQITLYPNPVSATIHCIASVQCDEICVYNATGIILAQIVNSERLDQDVSCYPEGVYFVRFRMNNSVYSKTFMIVQ